MLNVFYRERWRNMAQRQCRQFHEIVTEMKRALHWAWELAGWKPALCFFSVRSNDTGRGTGRPHYY
jgi:hypothetical protein